jgi:hypothetical protein
LQFCLRQFNNNNGRTPSEFQEANFEPDGEINIEVGRGKISYTRFYVSFFSFLVSILILSSLAENLNSEERNFWSNAPAFGIAQLWAKERTTTDRSNRSNELDVITLPVGVKSPESQYDHSPNTQPETRNATDSTSLATGHAASGPSFSDVGLDKVMEICSSAAALLKGRMDKSRKRGSAASRAASMLVSLSLPVFLMFVGHFLTYADLSWIFSWYSFLLSFKIFCIWKFSSSIKIKLEKCKLS